MRGSEEQGQAIEQTSRLERPTNETYSIGAHSDALPLCVPPCLRQNV